MVTATPMWGFIELGALLVLCMLGVPIAGALAIVGVACAWLYYGSMGSVSLVGLTLWSTAYSYAMSMVPLFVLMGTIIGASGLGRDAYDCFYKWLGRLRGGLAIVATLSSALFGCISGSTPACIATIGGISNPEMKRHGYAVELRLGSIAVAGILANLIPPSILAIFYCMLTETSVAKVFMAGLIPGIILTFFFSLTIYVWTLLRPNAAPKGGEGFSFKEKIISLKGPLPIVVIFIAMIGGIYEGIFSPTEAAGMGVVCAIALTLILRRLTWQSFKIGLFGTVRITGFLMFIIMSAMVFSNTIALTRFPDLVSKQVLGLQVSPLVLMFSIIAVIIFLGCVLEVFCLMVLFVPLFYPCIVGLGYSPIWYGTLTVMLMEIAAITPPVAGNIWVAQSLEPGIDMWPVVRGVIPFYAATLILLVLMVFFPQIVMWLPNRM